MLACTGEDALHMGHHRAACPSPGAVQIKMRKAYSYRRQVRLSGDVHKPRQSHPDQIGRFVFGIGSTLAKWRDRDHNQRRVNGVQIVIAQPQCREFSRSTRFNEEIGRRG